MLLLHFTPVPYDNEFDYLLVPYALWHPDFLAGDWMFRSLPAKHLVFNAIAGLPMLVLDPEVVGWLGRVGSWVAVFAGLLRIGGRLGFPSGMAAAAIALWLAGGQSVVGGEWMVRGFEAKVVAYPLLLFGIDAFLGRRDKLGAALLGLCFSFHIAVGLSAIFAVFVALVVARRSRPELARVVAWVGLFSLPGVLTAIGLASDSLGAGRDAWRFVVQVAFPSLLDPLTFPKRSLLLLLLMLGFVVWQAVRQREDPPVRFSGAFVGGLAVVFLAGVAARLAGRFELLQAFPFRLLPVFTPMFFFFHLAYAFHHSRRQLGVGPAVLALLALLLFNPLGVIGRDLDRRRRSWEPDPVREALEWIRDNTDPGVTVITNPARTDGYYWSRRAQIGSLGLPAQRDLSTWRTRVDALFGGSVPLRRMTPREANGRYAALTTTQIEHIVRKFGGEYLVTTSRYPYAEVYRAGTVGVYRLEATDAGGPRGEPTSIDAP